MDRGRWGQFDYRVSFSVVLYIHPYIYVYFLSTLSFHFPSRQKKMTSLCLTLSPPLAVCLMRANKNIVIIRLCYFKLIFVRFIQERT